MHLIEVQHSSSGILESVLSNFWHVSGRFSDLVLTVPYLMNYCKRWLKNMESWRKKRVSEKSERTGIILLVLILYDTSKKRKFLLSLHLLWSMCSPKIPILREKTSVFKKKMKSIRPKLTILGPFVYLERSANPRGAHFSLGTGHKLPAWWAGAQSVGPPHNGEWVCWVVTHMTAALLGHDTLFNHGEMPSGPSRTLFMTCP